MEQSARDAMMLAGPDGIIVSRVVRILMELARLIPDLNRLKQIAENPDHPLFKSLEDASPRMGSHMVQMRRAQVGALVRAINTIVLTQKQTMTSIPEIRQMDEKQLVDDALRRIGLDIDPEDSSGMTAV